MEKRINLPVKTDIHTRECAFPLLPASAASTSTILALSVARYFSASENSVLSDQTEQLSLIEIKTSCDGAKVQPTTVGSGLLYAAFWGRSFCAVTMSMIESMKRRRKCESFAPRKGVPSECILQKALFCLPHILLTRHLCWHFPGT